MYPEIDTFPDETQLYSGKRLLSFQGYAYPPLVDDAFSWKLPDSGSHFGREVRTIDDGLERRFELWSPNSVQLPYYPGIRSNVLDLRLSTTLEQRRYDGHLGKFDPTVTPQYYNRKRLWLAFIASTSNLLAFDWSARAEYVPIIRAWEVDAEQPYRGRLRAEFVKDLDEADRAAQTVILVIGLKVYRERADLWNNHPVMPLRADFNELSKVTTFEQAVDSGRQIQRWILEKQAWCRMAESWLEYRPRDLELPALQILPAKEEFMGVWIHGISEEDLKFYLGHARVPRFLVHELIAHETPGKLAMEDFIQGTPIATLLEPQNSEHDRIALRLNSGVHTLHDVSLPLPGIAHRPPAERLLSGSQNQWGPPAQGRGTAHSESPDRVSISDSDEDEERPDEERTTVPTGSEWSAAPRAMILGTEVTIPMMEVVPSTILKFTVPDTFAMDGMKAWLLSATGQTPGGRWLRMSRVEWRPRAHYYVEFDSIDAALRVKGLVNARDGTVRLVEFARDTEFADVIQRHEVITTQSVPAPPRLDQKRARPPASRSGSREPQPSTSRTADAARPSLSAAESAPPRSQPLASKVRLPALALAPSKMAIKEPIAPPREGVAAPTTGLADLVRAAARQAQGIARGAAAGRAVGPFLPLAGTLARGRRLLSRLEDPQEDHDASSENVTQGSTLFGRMGVSLEE
ncbi:hypothetical protein K438DRAFT_1959517 [Mycena galopus ATCC 62051]|nr:hypothetical protein K438DRAFT_1959517 [Mycena galopus ATCC 62051]